MSACHAMAWLHMILGGPSLLLSLYISYLSISYYPSSSPFFFLSFFLSFFLQLTLSHLLLLLLFFSILFLFPSFLYIFSTHISHLILIINFLLSFYSSSSPSISFCGLLYLLLYLRLFYIYLFSFLH